MSELPHRTNEHPPPQDIMDGLGLSEEKETPTPDSKDTTSASNFPPDYSDVPSSGVDEDGKQRRRYERGGRKKTSPRQQHEEKYSSPNTSTSSRRTGIRSFNVRRAQSGSARPFGVTVEKPQSQSKEKPKTKKKPVKKEPVKPVEPYEEEYPVSEEHEQQLDEYEDEELDEDEEEEEVRPEKPKEETRRPFAIRLDLNLEIEIFLKAKIRGDVTITFLE